MRSAAFLLLLLALAVPVRAAGDDHGRAREALERGEVLALGRILAIVEERFGGRVIEVEFERDDGRWLYELELVTRDGRLMEVEMDAATGAVLEAEVEDDDDRGWED